MSAGAVIVGGGQAGGIAAKSLRVAGYEGEITLVGAETYAPYERPPLSKKVLLEPDAPAPIVLSEEACREQRIRLLLGREVVRIDPSQHTVLLNGGETLAYDKLLLATGARVRPLSIPGVPADKIRYLRTLDDSHAIRARLARGASLVVVGGGFIGLEAAATAVALGCVVTVIEFADRLLPRLGCPEVGEQVLAHHRAIGVDVRLKTSVVRGEGDSLILSDGTALKADVIVAGIGVVPDTALAEAAGLKVDDGILVDEFGRTSDPHIFAAGDVTRHFNPALGRTLRLESWQNANLQAEAAARTLAGTPTVYAEIPWLWSDQGELNLQVAGAPANVTRVVTRGHDLNDGGLAYFQYDGDRLVGGVTLNRGREMPLIRRLLARPQDAPSPESLADGAVPLRRLLPARESA